VADRPQALALPPLLVQLRPFFAERDMAVYLVGGAVRDALLGRASDDLDFVVPEGAISLAFAVGDALSLPAYVLDRERDTGRVVVPGTRTYKKTMLDFARYRAGDLEGDLRARDFTINAMALPAGASSATDVIDPLGGWADLKAGLVRLASPAALQDDPVRTLRAVRMAVRFGFELVPQTAAAIATAAPSLPAVSAERVRDELVKLFGAHSPDLALQMLHEVGLLPVVLPEIAALAPVEQSPPHHEAVLAHTISTLRWLVTVEQLIQDSPGKHAKLEEVRQRLAPYANALRAHLRRPVDGDLSGLDLLRFGALFHDAGKAETQERDEQGRIRFLGHDQVGAHLAAHRLRQLRFSNEAIRHVERMVGTHMRPLLLARENKITRRAVFRFFRAAGSAGLDVGLLAVADHLATHAGPDARGSWERLLVVVETFYHHYFEGYEETIAPPPLLDGRALMEALGLSPGPEVGRLLSLLAEEQAAGEISTAEEALALAQRARRQ
jgi:poly(A) polymerase